MSVTERLKYLTNLIVELISKTKNIGQLDAVSAEDSTDNLYAAVYIESSSTTKKVNLKNYFSQEIGDVPAHTQSYSSITGIGDYKEIIISDDNGYNWKVKRIITDETEDSFKQNDIIEGFDEAGEYYYEIIVIAANISLPADKDDKTKVFHKVKKLVI